jgi:hypothetical protein
VSRVRGNLRAVGWKDKREAYVLFNMHIPTVEGNFKEVGKAAKPLNI